MLAHHAPRERGLGVGEPASILGPPSPQGPTCQRRTPPCSGTLAPSATSVKGGVQACVQARMRLLRVVRGRCMIGLA